MRQPSCLTPARALACMAWALMHCTPASRCMERVARVWRTCMPHTAVVAPMAMRSSAPYQAWACLSWTQRRWRDCLHSAQCEHGPRAGTFRCRPCTTHSAQHAPSWGRTAACLACRRLTLPACEAAGMRTVCMPSLPMRVQVACLQGCTTAISIVVGMPSYALCPMWTAVHLPVYLAHVRDGVCGRLGLSHMYHGAGGLGALSRTFLTCIQVYCMCTAICTAGACRAMHKMLISCNGR